MGISDKWVEEYLLALERTGDLDRMLTESPGLDAAGVLEVLSDARLGPNIVNALSDLMHPHDSMYYDAIFGAFHGQVDIRNWLVPAMEEITFIEFVPTQPSDIFDRDGATSSVDEWQMWMNLEGDRLPLSRGVSVRHYDDGWITWNADVYDTGPFRTEPTDDEPPPIPPPPRTPWNTTTAPASRLSEAATQWLASRTDPSALSNDDLHGIVVHPEHGSDVEIMAKLTHPTGVHCGPRAGQLDGRDAIAGFLSSSSRGDLRFDRVGAPLFNGTCTTVEWVATRPDDDSSLRGTSVRRYRDGHIIYSADYYDSAETSWW